MLKLLAVKTFIFFAYCDSFHRRKWMIARFMLHREIRMSVYILANPQVVALLWYLFATI